MSNFRLAGLLRLRRSQEEIAAAELARANAERQAARRRRLETEALLHGSTLPDRSDENAWRLAVASRAALGSLVAEHTLALAAAAAHVDARTQEWGAARVRMTTLEKLSDRHDVEVRAEEERLEQIVLDETATRRATRPDQGPDGPDPSTPKGER